MRCKPVLLMTVLLAMAVFPLLAHAANASDAVELLKAGIPEAVILGKLKSSGLQGSVSADDLIALKKAGFSTEGMKRLLELEGKPSKAQEALPRQGAEAGSTGPDPVFFHDTAGLNAARLKIMNRLGDPFRVALDPGLGSIRIIPGLAGTNENSTGGTGFVTLRPLRSVVHMVPPGEYMIHIEGSAVGQFVRVQPGDADLLAVRKHFGDKGMDFILSQNGSTVFASEGPVRPGVRTVYTEDYSTRATTREPERVIREVIVTPSPVIIDRGGYYWPNNYWTSPGTYHESWYLGYGRNSRRSHGRHGRPWRRGHGSSWSFGYGTWR